MDASAAEKGGVETGLTERDLDLLSGGFTWERCFKIDSRKTSNDIG